jgi:quercetin dioxygenase-like cupin family protein
MPAKETKTMKPATSTTERASCTTCKIALIGVFACIAAVALATPARGVLFNDVSRASVGPFHVESDVESESGRFDVELKSKGLSDIVTQTITLAPGGFSGWHTHPGPGILSVRSGTLTIYEADDPSCTPRVFPAGTGFVESAGDVHIARNEGTENLTLHVTYVIPRNAPQRIDKPMPGNCAF